MPPKVSFKPTPSAGARSRKKASVAVENEGSDHDIDQSRGSSPAVDGNIMEDELQVQERMEQERLNTYRAADSHDPMAVQSSNSTKSSVSNARGKDKNEDDDAVVGHAKMGKLSLQDVSPSSPFDDKSMEVDSDDRLQDADISMDPENEKLPDYADEGDELIKEIPVYLSQRLAKYLYLFQYPVRAAALPYTQGSGPSKARIKPISQLIELELPLDTSASQYNRERGEELAFGMNDKALRTALDGEPDDEDEKELLDRQTLISTLIPNATNYLAGVLRNDEMHLTPFHGAVQLRPSFKYLDKIDEKHKQANKKVSDEENKDILAKQNADQQQKAKALQVQVRSAADSEARKASGPNKTRLADDENWTKLDYFDADVSAGYACLLHVSRLNAHMD
ncbi:DNA-directed RNA polymerase III subunit RPC5 [Mortierella claussenii]|nr:DNA-directed RNA polymerase III subunit RPC5 [Mortierella claussenii]